MQTILGAGGAIGNEVAKALTKYTDKIRLVSRRPKKVNPADELFSADLLKYKELERAVEGSSVVYVTVGFKYDYKVWKKNWPKFTKNLIEVCSRHNSKLVFFDNIYMYDLNYLSGMTEETPVNPPSRKGEIRAEVSKMIMDAVEKEKISALIARSADFYGPGISKTSILTETVFSPLSKGKKASWLSSDKFKHSFTYTPDAGRATALLGNSEGAYNQVWHLPTASNPLTGKEWIEAIATELGVEPKYNVVGKFIVRALGLFIPIMKELPEMMYQYDRDYVFNSDKFGEHFNLKPTPYFEGIKEVISRDIKK